MKLEKEGLRQQQVEHAAGDQHIQAADQQLHQTHAQARQTQAETAEIHLPAARRRALRQTLAVDQQHRGQRCRQYGQSQPHQHGLRQTQRRRGILGIEEHGQGRQDRQAGTQRQTGEQAHPRDIACTQTIASIQAVTHRTAGQRRQSHRIADGKGAETAHRQNRRRQTDIGVTAGRPLIGQHHQKAQHGRQQSAEHRLRRYGSQRVVHLIGIDVTHQVPAGHQRQAEQQQRQAKAKQVAVAL